VLIDVGDLIFAARAGPQRLRDLDDIVVVEVEAGDGEIRTRLRGLLRQRDGPALLVELHHAVGTGVGDPVCEDGTADEPAVPGQPTAQPWSIEDVVAQHKCDRIVTDVTGTEDKGLRQAIG